jgi:hypothetical protein
VISTVGIRAVTPGVEIYYTGRHSPDARGGGPQGVRLTALSGATVDRINVSPIGHPTYICALAKNLKGQLKAVLQMPRRRCRILPHSPHFATITDF